MISPFLEKLFDDLAEDSQLQRFVQRGIVDEQEIDENPRKMLVEQILWMHKLQMGILAIGAQIDAMLADGSRADPSESA